MSTDKRKKSGQKGPKIVCVFRDDDGEGFTLEVVKKSDAKTKRIRGRNPVVLCSEAEWLNLVTFVKVHADQEG